MNIFIKNLINYSKKLLKIIVKKLIENLISFILYILNFDIKKYTKKKLVVFLFHEVTNDPSSYQKEYDLYVSIENFIDQLEYIKKNFNILNPKNLQNKKIPENSALITFDDGFIGSMKFALPILESKKIYSIHFLNSDVLEDKINISGLQKYLKKYPKIIEDYKLDKNKINKLNFYANLNFDKIFNSNEIDKIKKYIGKFVDKNELPIYIKKYKFFYIGNHLSNHYNVKNLTNTEIYNSFYENKKILSKFNNYLNYFSYPFGQEELHYDDKINNFVSENLTNLIFTANPKNYNLSSNIISRLPMFNDTKSKKIFAHIIIRNFKEYYKI